MPVLLVIVSAVLWGTYGSFVTAITQMGMARDTLVLLRFVATWLPVLILVCVRNPSDLRIRPRDIWLFLANGLASVFFFVWCYTAAIVQTKIATAAALLYTAPAMVLLISVTVFHERLSARKVVCVLAAVVGCALVSGLGSGDLGLTPRGLLLGLGAGLGYALYSIFSRMILLRGYSPLTNVVYTFLVASLAYLVLCVAKGELAQVAQLPGATALALVCGLATGGAAYSLYTLALARMEASRAAQLATLEPVVAAGLGFFLFGQSLAPTELVGVALVVGSVVAMNAGSSRRESTLLR